VFRGRSSVHRFIKCALPCFIGCLAPQVREFQVDVRLQGAGLNQRNPQTERRKWIRLPLAIPMFVRSRDEKGKEFLEFATALNVSAGGALIAVRRALPLAAQVLLEIPSAPLAATTSLPKASRTLRARTLRVNHAEGYHLVAMKFSHPLANHPLPRRANRR